MNYKAKKFDLKVGSVWNPLKAIISCDEVFILKNKYGFALNDNLMTNPLTLYDGLQKSTTETLLIKTDNFEIVGNSQCEISLRSINNGFIQMEKETLLKLVEQLRLIIEIQRELN